MKNGIFIGLDMGSTGLKAVAFDGGTGSGLAAAGATLPFIRLPGGCCELEATAIDAALMQTLQSVASQLGQRAAQVRALSCTGHGAGLYALDSQRRLLRGRAVASTDQRAAGRARALALRHGRELFEEVGCQPWAGQPSLIAAEVLGPAPFERGEVSALLFAKDYLGLLLSGAVATDHSDASTAGLLSLETGSWSSLAVAAAGLPDRAMETLPPIVPGGTVLGALLPERAARCG
ncbi:MAG: carbohydrate kinase, partial [Burkholderiales bacterium]